MNKISSLCVPSMHRVVYDSDLSICCWELFVFWSYFLQYIGEQEEIEIHMQRALAYSRTAFELNIGP